MEPYPTSLAQCILQGADALPHLLRHMTRSLRLLRGIMIVN